MINQKGVRIFSEIIGIDVNLASETEDVSEFFDVEIRIDMCNR